MFVRPYSNCSNANTCVDSDSQWNKATSIMRQREEQTLSKETSINQFMDMLLQDDRKVVDYWHLQQEEKVKKVAQTDNTPAGSVDRLEPSPIKPQATLQVCQKIDALPDFITQYCEDYIEVLSKLGKEDVQSRSSTVNGSPDLRTVCSDKELESMMDDRIHPYQNERWMERYQDLVEYFQVYGHFNVPYKQNPPLFQWVKRQRYQYRLRRLGEHSNLSSDRIEMLRKVGFVWDSHRAAWDEKFQELKEFEEIHGHCFVPCMYNGNSKLSTWIKRQRRQYRKYIAKQSSTLDEDRIKTFEDLGFAWDYYGAT